MTQSRSTSTIVSPTIQYSASQYKRSREIQIQHNREIQIQRHTNSRDLVQRLPPSVTVGVPDPPPHLAASLQCLHWPGCYHQYHHNATIPAVPSQYHASNTLPPWFKWSPPASSQTSLSYLSWVTLDTNLVLLKEGHFRPGSRHIIFESEENVFVPKTKPLADFLVECSFFSL